MIPLLKVENLKLHIPHCGKEPLHCVNGLSFEITQGEILGIVGVPGSGKTSLAHGLMGLFSKNLAYTSGDIRVEGHSVLELAPKAMRRKIRAHKIALFPQQASQILPPTRHIASFARDVLRAHYPEMSRAQMDARLRERIEQLDQTANTLDQYPSELSPLLRTITALGISTLLNPLVLIADAPGAELNAADQKIVLENLDRLLHQEVVHSLILLDRQFSILQSRATRIATLFCGEFVEVGFAEQLLQDPRHPCTKAMLQSSENQFPSSNGQGDRGCHYVSFCPMAQSDCHNVHQSMRTVGDRDVRCMYAK
ncbi:MAG TPA: ATP-binding cassette domain-containing protein [Fibrobacteraceae bacterium]|nr:ATP-binding cassette domain-containing protein [Fibrobacteraceae bacterium]